MFDVICDTCPFVYISVCFLSVLCVVFFLISMDLESEINDDDDYFIRHFLIVLIYVS